MAVLTRLRAPLTACGLAALAAAIMVAVAPAPALAQDLSPINAMFTTIGTALTGPTGRAIGLVALAAVGIAFFTGRMNWMFAGSVVLGLAMLFGAATILAGFA